MRRITITGTSENFGSPSEAIKAARGNALFEASKLIDRDEVIIDITYQNSWANGPIETSNGFAETTVTVGSFEDAMKAKEYEVFKQIQEARAMNFERELEIDSTNKEMLLLLTDKYGIDKVMELLDKFNEAGLGSIKKEVKKI